MKLVNEKAGKVLKRLAQDEPVGNEDFSEAPGIAGFQLFPEPPFGNLKQLYPMYKPA